MVFSIDYHINNKFFECTNLLLKYFLSILARAYYQFQIQHTPQLLICTWEYVQNVRICFKNKKMPLEN